MKTVLYCCAWLKTARCCCALFVVALCCCAWLKTARCCCAGRASSRCSVGRLGASQCGWRRLRSAGASTMFDCWIGLSLRLVVRESRAFIGVRCVHPCEYMVLPQRNSACVAGVHTPAKPVCVGSMLLAQWCYLHAFSCLIDVCKNPYRQRSLARK